MNYGTTHKPWTERLESLDVSALIPTPALATLATLLIDSGERGWPAPGIFPGETSGIRIEWQSALWVVVFEVDSSGRYFLGYIPVEPPAEPASISTRDATRLKTFISTHVHD